MKITAGEIKVAKKVTGNMDKLQQRLKKKKPNSTYSEEQFKVLKETYLSGKSMDEAAYAANMNSHSARAKLHEWGVARSAADTARENISVVNRRRRKKLDR